ncbi:hypothetical protein [Sphaerisporangium corydalis]|uniref:Uncharacterized protein n=1 Tax=Sphaerisporangium corydalis TaxID=1441875 RepID=A0ABV9EFZ2_9ACTN|nr:hypothetical protein [Sphaerisporangium corydalis]
MLLTGLTLTGTSARAAVPDLWGFAYVDVFAGVPDLSRQAGSWPAADTVTVSSGAVGEVIVRFPKIGTTSTGSPGVAHVTAVSPGADWCQVEKWWPAGGDELVAVRCYHYGGIPVFRMFSIVFEASSGTLSGGPALGYLHWNGTAVASRYSSVASPITVTSMGLGSWKVVFNGLGSATLAGNVQVTAVNGAAAARCKVGNWVSFPGSQQVQVSCRDGSFSLFDTGWTITYHRERAITGRAFPPKNFAYTYDNMPGSAGPYAPVPVAVNYNSKAMVNSVQTAGAGRRLVRFPQVGLLPNHVQATAYGLGEEYCNLMSPWAVVAGDVIMNSVACYNGPILVDQPSLVTYTAVG